MAPPKSPSSSKTAIVAGILAGLLAAGLGTYLLHLHRGHAGHPPHATHGARPGAPDDGAASDHTAPAAQSAIAPPVGQPAAVAPGAAVAHLAPASVARPAPVRSKAQASLALLALPELKAWSVRIEQSSHGRLHGALIEDDPAPLVVDGKRYWQFSFVANGADAASRWESFLVAEQGDEILVDDSSTDNLLSLEQWRQQKQPMARQAGPGVDGG